MEKLRNLKTFVVCLFLISTSFAVTGTLQDINGLPLEGVAVYFKKLDTTVTTNNTGNFELTHTISTLKAMHAVNATSLQILNRSLSLSLKEGKKVSISITNSLGREVFQKSGYYKQGSHLFVLPTFSQGVYFVNAKVGDDAFVKKMIPGNTLRWSGSPEYVHGVNRTNRNIDTIFFSLAGYDSKEIAINGYDDVLGGITLTKSVNTWFGFSKHSVDTAMPNFVHTLFRAYDINGEGIPNLDCSKILAKEDGEPVTSESKLLVEKATSFTDTMKTVLLIDNSSSIGDNLPKIKAAAKKMIKSIAPNQLFQIYAFSEEPILIQAFTNDTIALFEAIDMIPMGYASTNLYGALIEGVTAITDTITLEPKSFEFGNVILFTDGRDTQGSKTLNDVLVVKEPNDNIYTIGLGVEIDTVTLNQLSTKLYLTTSADSLATLFTELQLEIAKVTNSYYWAHYRSPKRGDIMHTIEFNYQGNENTNSDAMFDGIFSSALFQAGWAPVAKNVTITLNSTGDTLVGDYTYYDEEGDLEGTSKYKWKINGVEVIGENSLKLPLSSISNGDEVTFEVQPVSVFGSPKEGAWTPLSINISISAKQLLHSVSDEPFGVIKANDGYLFSGRNYVVKTSFLGDTLWVKNYGTANIWGICQTETGYIVPANSKILKIDLQGNLVWTKEYGSKFRACVAVGDGVLLGGQNDNGSTVLKINDSGDTLWAKQYGSKDNDYIIQNMNTTSTGFVLCGWIDVDKSGNDDGYALKISVDGTKEWEMNYGTKTQDERLYTVISDENGNLFFGGENRATNLSYIIQSSQTSGKVNWETSIAGVEAIWAVAMLEGDKSYYVGGTSSTAGSLSIASIDRIEGSSIWTRHHDLDTRGGVTAILTDSPSTFVAGTDGFYAFKYNKDGNVIGFPEISTLD